MSRNLTVSVRINDFEREKIDKILEKLQFSNQSDVFRLGLWKVFDEFLEPEDYPTRTLDYKIKNTVEAVLKEKGL